MNTPANELFFTRNDARDPRMGDIALRNTRDLDRAKVVLLGFPQDDGVRRNGGQAGAALGPKAIRRQLYKLVALPDCGLYDAGDTPVHATLEDTHVAQQAAVAAFLAQGKTVIALGGGNDMSYPDCAALSALFGGDIAACNVDAHFDVREQKPRNNGTPYRQLLDEKLIAADRFFEIGHQPFSVSAAHTDYLKSRNVFVRDCAWLKQQRLAAFDAMLACPARALFWGLDLDVVRASDAPGVSAPNPFGIDGELLNEIAALAGAQPRTRVFEISELNPSVDVGEMTARLAAVAVWSFLRTRPG